MDNIELRKRKNENKSKLVKSINGLIKEYAYKYAIYKQEVEDFLFSIDIKKEIIDEINIHKKIEYVRSKLNKFYEDNNYNLYESISKYIDLPYNIPEKYGICRLQMTEELLLMLFLEFSGTKRTRFSREADRILVAKAFRRLQYKTQVMVNSASDEQRTRLLHTLEVQKIAKTLSIQLNANWELAEAIALGHDVGHSPFGHSGEEALNNCLNNNFFGYFSHALQSVKVLNYIEDHAVLSKYGIDGISLSKEVLKGILKHDTDSFYNDLTTPGYLLQYNCKEIYDKNSMGNYCISIGGIESQIVYWSDKIAYLGHDWEEFITNDLLEKMLNRINDITHKMTKITDTYGIGDNDEHKLINSITTCLKTFAQIFQPRPNEKGEFKSELDRKVEFIKNMEFFLLLKGEIPEETTIFSKDQYQLLFKYFEIMQAWYGILDNLPTKIDASDDIVYIIYNYLKGITIRSITPYMQDKILLESYEKLDQYEEDMHEKGIEISVETLFQYCNDEFVKKIPDLSNKEKYKKDFQKSLIITYNSDVLENIEIISTFIKEEYISSTTVKNMKNKAEKIINELFYFYYKHPHMLPYKYRNKLQQEKLIMKENYKKYLYEYCKQELIKIIDYKKNGALAPNSINKEAIRSLKDYDGLCEYIKTDRDFDKICENVQLTFAIKDKFHYLRDLKNIISNGEDKEGYYENAMNARIIVDYIASMTDRMATKKYDEIMSSDTKWSVTFHE